MKKTVTIQEAIKANEHSRVRIVDYAWFKVGELYHSETKLAKEDILAEWEIEAKPIELWVNIYKSGICAGYESKSEADMAAQDTRIRCVKMREVDDVEGVG